MRKSKYQQYFHCFIFGVLVPYALWFSYIQRGGTYQREAFILIWMPKGAALIRGQCLFEARRLLEEIRCLSFFHQSYFSFYLIILLVISSVRRNLKRKIKYLHPARNKRNSEEKQINLFAPKFTFLYPLKMYINVTLKANELMNFVLQIRYKKINSPFQLNKKMLNIIFCYQLSGTNLKVEIVMRIKEV